MPDCSFCGDREATRELHLPTVEGAWASTCSPCHEGLEAVAASGNVIDVTDLDTFFQEFVDAEREA